MNKTGIFYGSTTGATAEVAEMIAEALGVGKEHVYDVAKTAPSALGDYDLLILGTSTWGDGEMQDDWFDFCDGAEVLDLKGKQFAVFGCGDETMSETFCNGMGMLYERFLKTGATPVGYFNEDGYAFEKSGAKVDGKVVGLVLDQVNHPELTAGRIKSWTEEIRKTVD